MKCISVRQPWAWCIVKGLKPVENRDWHTQHTGPLLIHAAKTFDDEGWKWIQRNSVRLQISQELYEFIEEAMQWPRGAIIGQVEMVDCVTEHASPWFSGSYGFVFDHPVELPNSIPYKGQLGIFDVPDSVLRGRP